MYWIQHLVQGVKRVNHAAVVIGNRIYSFGGYCSDEETSSRIDVHAFITVSLEWRKIRYSRRGDVPPALFGHTAVAYKNKVYIWGGNDQSDTGSSKLYCFDVVTLAWTCIKGTGHKPPATDGHSACVIGSFMYVFGGFEAESENLVNMLYRIDFNTFHWERIWTKGTQPSARDFHTASVVGSRMYIFGGRSFIDPSCTEEIYNKEIIYFDTETSTWVKPQIVSDEPRGRRSHSAAVYNGEIYIFGGCTPNHTHHLLHLNDVHKFNPEQNRWTELNIRGKGPNPRRRHCTVVIGDQLFLFGGSSPVLLQITSQFDQMMPQRLKEENDLFIMDLCPNLKRLCELKIIEYGCLVEFLPVHLQDEIKSLMKTKFR